MMLLFSYPSAGTQTDATVATPWGLVRGNMRPQAVEYLNLPYAEPGTRFEEAEPWTSNFTQQPFMATTFGHGCPQPVQRPIFAAATTSEDCLALNVFVPRATSLAPPETLKAVMVWIHGGALVSGSAMLQIYNGTRLAGNQDVVVVTVNYRVGVFGFMPVGKSNLGFRDQRLALQWVQSNIRLFGGDPGHVTIFGQSAGGQSVATHMVSPGSAGLFHRGISQSGDIDNVQTLREAMDAADFVAKKVGCSSGRNVTCLRAADANTLVSTWAAMPLSSASVIDGDVLPATPVALMAKGSYNRVPCLLGSNRDEGSFFLTAYIPIPISHDLASCAIVNSANNQAAAAKLLALYPPLPNVDNKALVAQYFTDVFAGCDARRVARSLCASGACPHVYRFDRSPSCPIFDAPGAFHTAELPFVFQNQQDVLALSNSSCRHPTEVDTAISSAMAKIWTNFAKEGTANFANFGADETQLVIDVIGTTHTFSTAAGTRGGVCDALDEIGAGPRNFEMLLSALFTCMVPPPPHVGTSLGF